MMSKSDPFISVLMPVYNGEKYLREAIDSILNQTYTNFEFIIINDGSTDTTEEIILSYEDERILYIKNEENLRLIRTLNKGLDLAKGKYIARMDADDISLPSRLEKQVKFMEKNPEVGLCGTFLKTIGNREDTVSFHTDDNNIRFRLLFSTYLRHPSVMIKSEIIKKYDLKYNSDYLHVEDHKMWIDISKHTQLAIIPNFLLKYRVHDENISVKFQQVQAKTESKIRKEQLQELKIEVNESQLKIYNNFIHLVRKEWNIHLLTPLSDSITDFYELDYLLENIVQNNRDIKKVDSKVLEYEFGKAYLKLLQHITCFGSKFINKALKNPLFETFQLSNNDITKLKIKALIKKNYNYNKLLNFPLK